MILSNTFFNLLAIEADAILYETLSNEIGRQFLRNFSIFISFWYTGFYTLPHSDW
jgi:hypothetical protein